MDAIRRQKMSKIIDYINENRWVKLLANFCAFAPLIQWLFHIKMFNRLNDISGMLSSNLNYAELITALITTGLLLTLIYLSQALIKKLKEAETVLNSYQSFKAISNSSHFFRAWKMYTREGLGMEYYDMAFRDKVLKSWLSEEFKFVFNDIQTKNPTLSPEIIHNLMTDFYQWDKKEMVESINQK